MKKLLLGLLVLGFTTQFMFSQEIELSEVYLDLNYQYLAATDSEDLAIPVKNLEEQVAFYNIKESYAYNDQYETFRVYFIIPEGKIVARYDREGKIINTVEKFKNIDLPQSVQDAAAKEFPNWKIVEDIYKVYYNGETGNAKKHYLVKMENGSKRKVLKLNNNGLIL